MMTITKARLGRNGDEAVVEDIETARDAALEHAAGLIDVAFDEAARRGTFLAFETGLVAQMMAFARAVVVLFLVASEQRERAALGSRRVWLHQSGRGVGDPARVGPFLTPAHSIHRTCGCGGQHGRGTG
jgi:hypothetical protein